MHASNRLLSAIFLAVPAALAAASPVVPEGAKPQLIQGGFKFTEGPALAPDGRIFFSDIPNNRIHVYDPAAGKVAVHRENTGGANGLMFGADGALLACEGRNRQVTRQEGDSITVIVAAIGGKRLNSPNDLDLDRKGGIYFTDPMFSKNSPELDKQGVYHVAGPKLTAQSTVTRVIDDLVTPNGVILSLDGKTLYVSASSANRVHAYDVQPDGTVKNGRVFATMDPAAKRGGDGMTLDERGNLYVTAQQYVWVFSPTGESIGKIEVPESPANCVFGAKGTKTLYITARTGFYKINLNVDGAR